MKKIIFAQLFGLSVFMPYVLSGMELNAPRYNLSVKKVKDSSHEFALKISKKQKSSESGQLASSDNEQTCSFIANFETRTCNNQQNLFPPFNGVNASNGNLFGDASSSDAFLWNIPDFGLLGIQQDGSVFFGSEQDDAPLANNELTLNAPGTLFLKSLKVAALRIKAKQAQICQALITDRFQADHCVQNNGCLKTRQLLGDGEFLNAGLLEFEGTEQSPALLAIKKFQNKKRLLALQARVRGSHLEITNQNHYFKNSKNGLFDVSELLQVDALPSGISSLFLNKGSLKAHRFTIHRPAINEGFLQAHAMRLEKKSLDNREVGRVITLAERLQPLSMRQEKQPLDNKEFGQVSILEEISIDTAEIKNAGDLTVQGNVKLTSGGVQNSGTMLCKQGNLSCVDAKLSNTGKLLLESMKSLGALDVANEGTLGLKGSDLHFKQLSNTKDLVLHGGIYLIDTLTSKKLQLLENDWIITGNPQMVGTNKLVITKPRDPKAKLGEIECNRNLTYDLEIIPTILRTQADIYYSKREVRDTNQLKALLTPLATTGKVIVTCASGFVLEEDLEFPNIGHLELVFNGSFKSNYALKAPILTLRVDGPIVLGSNNQKLGTIAASHGPLTVTAHTINGQFGKFYGKGKTVVESTQGNILIGAPSRGVDENIKQQFINQYSKMSDYLDPLTFDSIPTLDYHLNQLNGAYIATDDHITLRSAENILIQYGTVLSVLGNNLVAKKEIQNLSGKISSHGPITIEAEKYNHTRDGFVPLTCVFNYPGSGPASLESLETINFKTKNIHNRAGSIKSGRDIVFNGLNGLKVGSGYIEEPQQSLTKSGFESFLTPVCIDALTFKQSCTVQSGGKIQINLGNFVITGNMNAGTISIQANHGLFSNNSVARQTLNPAQPLIIDVTKYLQGQAQHAGILRLGANQSVETEFPIGVASAPLEGDVVLLENPALATPQAWRDIFNPLGSINLDLYLQQLLSNLAGKVYAGNAKGNKLATILWANANKWRHQHNKDVMSHRDVQNLTESMLLSQILNNGLTEQQQTLLCIAPADINPYQNQGDIVADTFECATEDTQTHLNTRIIATGPQGVQITSSEGNVNLETQRHQDYFSQQWVSTQQQLIATAGPIAITAHGDISRTGDLIAAAGNVTERAETGSIIKNPNIVQTIFVNHSEKKKGFSSTKKRVETSINHQVIPSITISGGKLHEKAAVSIKSSASQDSAQQEIRYESPNTTIEGLILADRTITKSSVSTGFSKQSMYESKEKPYAARADIRAPIIRLVGENARINATIIAQELHDETTNGAQFVAKVAQMLCSGRSLGSSPFGNADAGYDAGYETMIQPMLMVEKIVRSRDFGQMLFESAIIDKDNTEIIGKFVETTYQLKQWQTSWSHKSQLIPDAALVVVALAITIATQGTGAELMAPLLQGATAATGMQLSAAGIAMLNAGFSAACSALGTSLLRTGDPLQSISQLASPAQLKSIAFNMASAGLCSQLGDIAHVNMSPGLKPLITHVQEQALRATVDTLLNVAINHAPIGDALGDAVRQIPLRAAAAYAANEICTSCIDPIAQRAAQTLVGGLSGFAMDQSAQGFASGAIGALTAEVVGEYVISDARAISEAAITKLAAEGLPLTPENVQQAIAQEVQGKTNIAKIAAGSVAVLTRQNASIAIASATNAIDNDVAIRGTLYALVEYQSLVSAASQAIATLQAGAIEEIENYDDPETTERQQPDHEEVLQDSSSAQDEIVDEAVEDLILQSPLQTINHDDEDIIDLTQEQPDQSQNQRSLHDRIVNPETLQLIKETGEVIKVVFVDALNKTIDVFSIVPNPVGMACFAAETGREIYKGDTTLSETVFNLALGYGALKGVRFAGKGIKVLYKRGKVMAQDITNGVINRRLQKEYAAEERYAAEGRIPFVENSRAGKWDTATLSGELILRKLDSPHYSANWDLNPKAPFFVRAHGSPLSIHINIGAQEIHPKGLSRSNLKYLQQDKRMNLGADGLARLIKTAPGYKGQSVVLSACRGGAWSDGIAQQLAHRMGVPVSAFTESITISDKGQIVTYCNDEKMYGIMKTFYPDKSQRNRAVLLALLPALLPAILSGDQIQLPNAPIELPWRYDAPQENTVQDVISHGGHIR